MRHVLLSVPEPDGGHDLSCSIFRRARAHGRWPRCRGRGADCVRGVCGPLPRRGPVHCPTLPQDAGAPGACRCICPARNSVSELLHPAPLYLRWPSAKFEQHPVAQPLRDSRSPAFASAMMGDNFVGKVAAISEPKCNQDHFVCRAGWDRAGVSGLGLWVLK
jgi:hypothetical protein